MITEIKKEDRSVLVPLFSDTEETMILSCIQGHMGKAFADNAGNPHCAQIMVGDFCFFAGDFLRPEAQELVRNIPQEFLSDTILMIPLCSGWGDLIEKVYSGRFEKTTRYAVKKEPDVFGREYLEKAACTLPDGFTLCLMDEDLYYRSLAEDFSKDFCSLFDSAEDFVHRGLGVCALYQDKIVAGASSYSVYDGGIEIEVDTHPDFRRRGLALACAAKLILECLDRGLYPSWDAATPISAALAQKLGYHLDFSYLTYLVKHRDTFS